MGSCCGKIKEPDEISYVSTPPVNAIEVPDDVSDIIVTSPVKTVDVQLIDELVMEMLNIAASRADSEDESPVSLVRLHTIADRDEGWIQMMISIVKNIPLDSPFSPTAMSILLDDCPLPSRHTVIQVAEMYQMTGKRARSPILDLQTDRNLCVIFGCIADKLVGPICAAIFTQDTFDYLYTFLKVRQDPRIVLYSLVALIKFGYTSANKEMIVNRLAQEDVNPLIAMEKFINSSNYAWRQVGFCCNWALDNMFVAEGRELTYLKTDNSAVNAMLNVEDASEYLQLRSDGLEARCDSYSFESVRCTFQVDEGCWYYECLIITSGVMQIGWATKNSYFQNDGFGIGDDNFSVSYDGCRKLLWFCAKPMPVNHLRAWLPGDILGCLIDVKKKEIIFTLNGLRVTSCRQIFESAKYGFHAGASFMAYQQCRFNFGSEPFKFPPKDRKFSVFNDYGMLCEEERTVVPRRILMAMRRCSSVKDNACTLCCDEEANCILEPCGHRGFCSVCTAQLRDCPLCRADILNVKRENI